MTRETKAGIVVSGSFLCLVGVVFVCKMKEKPPAPVTPYVAADGSVQAPADPTPAADGPAAAPVKPGTARPEPLPSTEQVALNILPSGRDGGVRPAVATGSEPQSTPAAPAASTPKPEGAPSASADPKVPPVGNNAGERPSATTVPGAPAGEKISTSPTTTPAAPPPPKDSLSFPSMEGDKGGGAATPPVKERAKAEEKLAVPPPAAQEKQPPSEPSKTDPPKPDTGKSDLIAPPRPGGDLGVGSLSGSPEPKNPSKADEKHPREGDAKAGLNSEEHAPNTIKMPPPAQALGADAVVPSREPGKSSGDAKERPIVSPGASDPIVPPSERSIAPPSERTPSTRPLGTPPDPGAPKTPELGQPGAPSLNRPATPETSRPATPSPVEPLPSAGTPPTPSDRAGLQNAPPSSTNMPPIPRSAPADTSANPPLPPLPTGPSGVGSFSTASQENRGTRLGAATPPPNQLAQVPRPSTPFEGGSGESHGNLPPLGGSPPVMSPAPVVPQVESYDEQMYRWKAGDTFGAIARNYYGSDRYEKALLLFNRDHPRAADGVRLDPPALQADQLVFVPPANVLAKQYPQAIGAQVASAQPVPVQPAPVQTLPTASAVGLAAPVRDPAVTQTGSAEKFYKVRGNGEWFRDIARNILKDGDRWWDIARLNTQYDPAHLVPTGTLLRVPSDARIDLQNQP